MSWWKPLTVLLLMAMPLAAQAPRTAYLTGSDYMCEAELTDGTHYEIWDRVLVVDLGSESIYLMVHFYYKPGSGEFLWRSNSDLKNNPQITARASCEEPYRHILILQDGEWADFWAENGRVTAFHSNLKFDTRDKVWSYIAEHWQDGPDGPVSYAKWVVEIVLYQQLGHDFFRPKRLEFDARPYTYDSLVSAKKVGTDWELEIRGADEPNRATVMLDSSFKLLGVTKSLAPTDRHER